MKIKHLLRRNLVVVYILAVVTVIVLFPNFMSDGHDASNRSNRKVFLPSENAISGIDISKHNGIIDWQLLKDHKHLKKQFGFVFIKATEGGDLVDPFFKINWDNATAYGFTRGAYHFFTAFTHPEIQAINYLSTVNHKTNDFVPILDFENDGRTRFERDNLTENAKKWLETVEKEVGIKPVIYTNKLIYRKYIKNKIEGYDIWLADYTVDDPRVYNIENLIMWQHSNQGKVAGINENVDLNVFYGSQHKFEKYLIK